MSLNIIIDVEESHTKEVIQQKLNESMDSFQEISYQNIQTPLIVFKEVHSYKQLKEFKHKTLGQHTIIFIIDNPEYMFASLEQYPLCFIRKSDFDNDLNKAIELILNVHHNLEQILTLKMGYSFIRIQSSQITYIESYGHYLVVHTTSGGYKVREKLNHILEKTSQQKFTRIHKSYIINEKYMKEKRANEVVLMSNITLPIGRKYKSILL